MKAKRLAAATKPAAPAPALALAPKASVPAAPAPAAAAVPKAAVSRIGRKASPAALRRRAASTADQVVAVPGPSTPAAEQLVRLAACVLACWPGDLNTMPAQLAAQVDSAFAARKAA